MHKKIITIFLITIMCTTPLYRVQAGYWGENFGANSYKQMLEEMSRKIMEAINAAAKMAAIKQATSTIENLLYGGSSSPRNIQNYNEFLIQDPQNKAVTYGQDFLTNTLRGTTSADYTSFTASSGSDGLGAALEMAGQGVIDSWEGNDAPTVDYMEYCSDSSDLFADGDFRCFSAIMSNPINTPIGMALAVDQVTAAKYQQEKEVAQLIATSTGALPQLDESGNVTLPSSVVEEIQLQQITLPLQALANGDASVFSSMIQSFAITLLTKIVNDGMSEAQEQMNKNSTAFQNQFQSQFGDIQQSLGPGSNYSSYDDTLQQSGSNDWINPDTGAPF